MTSETRATHWFDGIRPYVEPGPLAAFFLGISSGFPFAMIAATLTTRLAQSGIDKKSVTAFSLAILVYNFKPLWAWMVDGVRLPLIGRLGQRVSWMLLAGTLVILAVINLGYVDPTASVLATARAAILVGLAGATYDIIIDAYRIETLAAAQLGPGSGMTQYGWRIGSQGAAALALIVAGIGGWGVGYACCTLLALPAMATALVMGEPASHRAPAARRSAGEVAASIIGPLAEFFRRRGALLILAFIVFHKIGDTLANLSLRLLFNDMGYSNPEIAVWDVGIGFWTFLIGVFIGGALYARLGLKRSVIISLWLMCVSNLSFAALAAYGHSIAGMALAEGFENLSSGIGGVCVTAYFSALCDLRFTASQYALISAAASIFGRLVNGTTTGAMIESVGYVNFYIFTTIVALPGILFFWLLDRKGYVDRTLAAAIEEREVSPA